MDDLQEILGKNMRMARARMGLSQEDLAALTNLDRTYISGVERGVRNPTLKVLERIAQGLKIAPHQLLRKDD